MSNKIVIDVRSPMEFMCGNVVGSINIPLQEIPQRIDEIKEMKFPIILCCASGARSGNAAQYLKSCGIECENGGGWMEVNIQSKSPEIN
ncbi:MAG: rhodanese-like domain-containing protein [Ginsengibacter sp.]|jgi:rhodanese-related sulfurtransferase